MPVANNEFISGVYHTKTARWIASRLSVIEVGITKARCEVPMIVVTVAMSTAYQPIVTSALFDNTVAFRGYHVIRTNIIDALLTVGAAVSDGTDALFSDTHSIARAFKVCTWFNAGWWNATSTCSNRIVHTDTTPRIYGLFRTVP